MPDERELDETIQQCASRCVESGDPLSCVDHFVRHLVTVPGWAQPDAEVVAHEALKVIARILHNESLEDTVANAHDRESEVET